MEKFHAAVRNRSDSHTAIGSSMAADPVVFPLFPSFVETLPQSPADYRPGLRPGGSIRQSMGIIRMVDHFHMISAQFSEFSFGLRNQETTPATGGRISLLERNLLWNFQSSS
jgi:hypothetical protein